MRLGILLFTPILLLAGVTLHAQEAVNAPEPVAAADSAANAELKAQLKAELLSEIRAELSSEVKTAVSKEADKPSRLTVGGYGEAVMTRNFFSDNYLRYISPDKYKNDKSHGRFDLPHVVIYLGYDFGRGWSMGTEIEFEHGGTESAFETEFEEGGEYESEIERGGEVALEQFWLQKSFSPAFNLRLGHMIVPVGGTNQHHMPTEFFGVYRPEGENTILPCTWHETGISLWGRAGDWRYEVMFLPGLDSDRFGDNGWVSGGAGSPYEFKIANAYAGAFRIDNYSVPGLRLSLSGYAGNSFSNTLSANRTGADRYKDVKGTVMIGAFDFLYDAHNWIVRGNFDYGHLTNSDKISQFNRDMPNASPSPKQYVGSDAIATGVEAGYDIFSQIRKLKERGHRFYVFGRYEFYDSMFDTAKSVIRQDWCGRQRVAVGFNYYPIKNIVIKAEYGIGLLRSYDYTDSATGETRTGRFNNEPSLSLGIAYSGFFRRSPNHKENMKNLFKNSVYAAAALVLALGAASCSDSDGDYTFADEREEALKDAAVDFVDNNVIPTYKALADGSIALQEDCEAMLEAFDAGTLTTPLVQAACNDWITTRKHWELSEAYLYGAAADYDIDPHIDSWPLDGTALQNLLNNNSMMAEIERNPDYVSANLGYGLLGFHALEYMLFENAGPRALGKYTRPQLVYLVGVANDLCNMCVRLEASWAGLDNVTEEKQTILGDAELEPTFDYGASMRNSGKGGSKYRNYKDAAEEIIQGCIDIATEVGSQKIGRPANGTSSEDINYIESPYSQNSKTDFIDNIISIRNTYQGMTSGDASVSDWIEVVDPVLDTEVRNAISTAIEKIQACPAPFVDNRTAQAWKDAATYCNNDLVNALTKALTALSVEK